jgi:hypothetical protein
MGGIFLGMYFYGDSDQGSNWDIVYTLGENSPKRRSISSHSLLALVSQYRVKNE